jgi:VIT1/CCC1 family predicted Fe2+/Mn2+ transporter
VKKDGKSLFRPAIFGLGDGCMSIVGVILYLLGDQHLIVATALSGAISAALSMAGNEYLSDSDNGLWPSVTMGLSTGAGGVLPALPFIFWHGATALVVMGVICLLIGIGVGWMRGRACEKHTMLQEISGTLIIFALIFGCVIGVAIGWPVPAG